MAEDFDALVADLTTNPRYDAEVVSGDNGAVQALLHEIDDAAAFVFDDVLVEEVQEAAGQPKMASLTSDQRGRLQAIKQSGQSGRDFVATSLKAIRDELIDVFGISEAQLIAGVPSVQHRPTYGEVFGYKKVGLDTVRQAVRQIDKSFIVTTGQV